MASLIRMPQKGLSEDSAILSKWYVKEGDTVKKGDFVFAIETGKATFDGIDSANVVGTWRVNIPYSSYTGE